MITLGLTGLVVAAIVLVLVGFHKLRTAENAAQEALVDVDLHLLQRADLVTQLVAHLRDHTPAEERRRAYRAAGHQVAAVSSGVCVETRALAHSRMVEAAGQLVASAHAAAAPSVRAAVEETRALLAEAEGRLRAASVRYDDCARTLNRAIATMPWSWVAGLAAVAPRQTVLERL